MYPCDPTTTADHQAGEEATQVTVIVSFTCSGIAYNGNVLRAKVTQLLNAKALKKFGTGYTLQGNVQVSVQHTTITPAVFLSFSSSGTWVYALTEQVQQHIKALVTGQRKTIVMQLLRSLPGIERVSLAGGDDSTPLPKETSHIHIVVIYRSR